MVRTFVCLILAAGAGLAAAPEPPRDPRAEAIRAIEKLGGTARDDGGRLRIDLRRCRITDADLALFRAIPETTFLDLSDTAITNAGLVHLKGLIALESLSLYNTAVDDQGLEHLTGMKKLFFLLMKQTNVTEDGVKMLKRALPDCETISHSPRTPAIAMPVGKWTVTFANGVVQTCEIGGNGAASVVEPRRSSGGRTLIQGRTAKLVFKDDRVERWTPVGNRFVVEHWAAASDFPAAAPVFGIAEKAP